MGWGGTPGLNTFLVTHLQSRLFSCQPFLPLFKHPQLTLATETVAMETAAGVGDRRG